MNEEGRGPSAEPLLTLIGEHLESIRTALDDAQHALLLTRLKALAEASPGDGMAVPRALQGVRLALRQLPFGHPVRTMVDGVRLVAAPPGPQAVTDALKLVDLLAAPGGAPVPEPEPQAAPEAGPEAVPEAVPDRDPAGRADRAADPLLREPALSAAEATARCGGAPPPELIRLPDPPNGYRYPEFQFPAGGGTPYEVVLEVNRLLMAEVDPRGAAAWWYGGNSWLSGPPVSLLGRMRDHELVGAATALVEGE
ncbi:hypothetical protein OG898_25440 [Streptomyces sp. NBC_00193]|uniref:hypothetical protein n=1 Tax=Streptomyces sp. NBC_00193 TaxID=2975675 RepID=UPI002254BFB0|nr:hypothetical protein [Streptomyces sp. NBC_00193]MCX5299789.1 hypothetical protein [Streptomyces sp. NBC_00193]